jgi:hypothetical protein
MASHLLSFLKSVTVSYDVRGHKAALRKHAHGTGRAPSVFPRSSDCDENLISSQARAHKDHIQSRRPENISSDHELMTGNSAIKKLELKRQPANGGRQCGHHCRVESTSWSSPQPGPVSCVLSAIGGLLINMGHL